MTYTLTSLNHIRRDLADTLEDIGSAMGLLREADDEISNGNSQGGKMCASDALDLVSGLEATFSALASRIAIISEN
jgi:hypothetical protein